MGTALSLTLQHKECGFADKLLACGANPNTHEEKSHPPLIEACKCEHVYLIKKLIDHNADVNRLWIHPSNSREPPCSPLLATLKTRADYQLKTLLDLRADPNRRIPPRGDSSTSGGDKGKEYQSLVKILVDYGANCEVMNDLN